MRPLNLFKDNSNNKETEKEQEKEMMKLDKAERISERGKNFLALRFDNIEIAVSISTGKPQERG